MLFELIAERYERKSIAITANQPFAGWDHVFAETAMTLAVVDRLVHHSNIFVQQAKGRLGFMDRLRSIPPRGTKNLEPPDGGFFICVAQL